MKAVEDYPWKSLAQDAEERHTAMVVAIAAVALILAERDDLCVPHVLGYRTLFSALQQELV